MTEPTQSAAESSKIQDPFGNFETRKKKIETWSLISLLFLIVSIIFITFGFKLPAGCCVIAAAAVIVLTVRKYSELMTMLRRSFLDLSSSNEKKEEVITDFSHRIREPLNNLVIIADLLMDSGLQKKQKELVETLAASTNNMSTTVNELTMQSAGSLSYIVRKPIRFNILSTIQNTIELYGLKAKTGLDLILSRKDYNDFECEGDPIIIRQIFLDLFNSIESQNSERTTRVTISLRKERDSGNERYIGFRIQTDNNQELINKESNSGNLALRLISDSKGIFSQETGNNCSVLNITLPFTCPETTVRRLVTEIPRDDRTLGVTKKELADLNILLVEDDLINQKITLLALNPLVRNVDTASNGKEALVKIASAEYDLILMDIQMPVMDGMDTAEKIREMESGSDKHIPIIAITANAMIGDMEKCLASGIDDYISKPYLPVSLVEKIKRIISGPDPIRSLME